MFLVCQFKFSALCLFGFIFFFFFPSTILAQIVINEVFPNPSGSSAEKGEFIEILNVGDTSLDITGYSLEETKIYTLPPIVIGSGEYLSFTREETGLALNNTGDTILLKNVSGDVLDSFTFPSSIEDKSWSRYPDGTGDFANNTIPTQNSPNAPPPSPTPTPIPPTKAPTNTPFPSPTPTLALTATMTPTVAPTSAPTSEVKSISTESDTKKKDENNIPTTFARSTDDYNSKDGEISEKKKRSIPFPALLFILGGFSLMASSIFLIKRGLKT